MAKTKDDQYRDDWYIKKGEWTNCCMSQCCSEYDRKRFCIYIKTKAGAEIGVGDHVQLHAQRKDEEV